MDRRAFIRNMFITAAVAAAEKTSLGQVLKSYGGCVLTPDKSIRVDHLPDDMRWSMYDNFDGRGGWQTGTRENIAVDGEFSPRLWSFYQGTPTIETLEGEGKNSAYKPAVIPVDENGIPVEVYKDPFVLSVLTYFSGEEYGSGEREFYVRELLNDEANEILSSESDLDKKILRLAELDRLFSDEGLDAVSYLRTGDLKYLENLSGDAFNAVQKIREGADVVPGRGPRSVIFRGVEDISDYVEDKYSSEPRWMNVSRGEEYGRIDMIPETETGARRQIRFLDEADLEARIQDGRLDVKTGTRYPAPRRPSGRARPYEWLPNPDGNVVRMEKEGDGDMRLELNNPIPMDFQYYTSWSADVMLSSESTSESATISLDYHTSIPEQPPGASWFCGMGLMKNGDYLNTFIAFSNKNTSYRIWYDVHSVPDANLDRFELDTWYNLRLDIIKLNEQEAKFIFMINGKPVFEEIPPDSEILLDPTRLAFGPIRNFAMNGSYGNKIAYIDNVMGVFMDVDTPAKVTAKREF